MTIKIIDLDDKIFETEEYKIQDNIIIFDSGEICFKIPMNYVKRIIVEKI